MSGDRDSCAGTHLGVGFRFPAYIPVIAEFTLPDFELYTYFSTVKDRKHLFFLESLTGDEHARYSMLGYDPLLVMESREGSVRVDDRASFLNLNTDIFSLQRAVLQAQLPELTVDVPHFYGGLVGYWGYDLALATEGITRVNRPVPALPDAAFFLPRIVVVHDRHTSTVRVFGFYPAGSQEEPTVWKQVQETVRAVTESARHPVIRRPGRTSRQAEDGFTSNTSGVEFLDMVARAQRYINRGDIFQVVLSQRWRKHTRASPEDVYAELRDLNPSPYMFYLRFPGYTLVGSSPEMMVRVEGDRVQTRPIAGTRPVTGDAERDAALRRELLEDVKERAEHLMLVDLGRNDVGKVSRPGTVRVGEFMKVEAYSHVVHLVSTVEGRLRPGEDGLSALRACYPAGTLTGAPKRRAMEIIDQLEKDPRGPYGGAVGYVGLNGCLDSCITIRSILFRNGCCYLQAGAGIVADSVPRNEYRETVNKARALMKAVLNAEGSHDTDD
ncbi:MAG: anthranilate synthase component I family protein [Syntrophomonadaceae bacterium]|nr:anthranilate synthase component I family protein [Syntrophomonadaceae bacterium]